MKKLLIVDDDEDILELVKTAFTMHRYDVEGLTRWEDMDACISGFSPELILLDISLKGADGRDICRKLKSSTTTHHIPVLLFSANIELGKSYAEYNAQGFIEKPFELPRLLNTIKQHLESPAINP